MKKASTVLIWTGVGLFVIKALVGLSLYSFGLSHPALLAVALPLSIFPNLTPLILIGLGLTLSFVAKGSAPVSEGLDASYVFWRNFLVGGIVFWFFSSLGVLMSFDAGGHLLEYTALFLYLLALFLAIVALIAAHIRKQTDIARAIFILKVPFYYALIGIFILAVEAFLGFR